MSTDVSRLPQHLHANGLDGYIYAVALSTGLVKVGKTVNPRARLGSHVSHATRVGVDVLDVWLSSRHENYADNERALIRQLAPAERGNEYFRRDFADVVRIAEALTFVTCTENQRRIRDARYEEELRARPRIFEAIAAGWDSTQRQYERVSVPADMQVWALQMIFSPQLPSPASSDEPCDPAAIFEMAERISAATGTEIEEILDWSYLDLLLHLARTVVQTGWLELKIRALEAGRSDLTDHNYFTVADDAVDEFLRKKLDRSPVVTS